MPQLWTSDVTPENLGVIMAENDDRMAILSDEGGIFDILAVALFQWHSKFRRFFTKPCWQPRKS